VKSVFLLTIFVLCCYAAFAQAPQPSPSTGIEEVYLARDNGEGKAGDQVTEFKVTDIPIYCVVLLDSTAVRVVKMNFVAVNVSGVKPETKVVTASYTTKDGQNRVFFTGRPYEKWTPGRYRVDLLLDGKIAKNVEFDIKGVGGGTTASKFQANETIKPKPPKRTVKNQP